MNPYPAIARQLRQSQRVLFITGAGISADSGLPTYRGLGGLYEDTATDEGYAIEEALSGGMMAAHPEITWKYLLQIERNCRGARPNLAHEVIASLERIVPEVIVYTQNVDGLHLAAGSRHVIEIHGNLHRLSCTRCAYRTEVDTYEGLADPPLCPRCGAPIRPAVVLFGEALPTAALLAIEDALAQGVDMVFSVGTSSLFPYIVEPVVWASAEGIPTVEINPAETGVSGIVDHAIRAGAAEAMGRIWHTLLADGE
ncbi:NAD-dependent deacylase [Azospira restricta]|uniref:protein acetyllysine N-acetyltransferase n=1 Tax=Azospira restricta TaxID=404405 RepID=A0A974SN49_9RHOO|nr:NAD-dependent deacylase [Azospira restricta]QRJ62889.1 NAD-dependent deacylase [Azospira restricta]